MEPFVSTVDLNAFTDQNYTGNELLVGIALDVGCQAVRDYLGQEINLHRDDVELHDGNGTEGVLLKELPVIAVTAVVENDIELDVGLGYIVGDAGMLWRCESTTGDLPLARRVWYVGKQNIVVTYDHGWAITEDDVVDEEDEPVVDRVPATIRMVALALAAKVIRASTLVVAGGTGSLTGETIGDYSYTTDASLTLAQVELQEDALLRQALDHYLPGP